MEVELEKMMVEVGLDDLVIFCLVFNDILIRFLVYRIKRFVVE